MALLIFYFLLAIGVSFLCSILEAVFLSITPSFISAAKKSGSRPGRILDRLKGNVDRPLAAILSLNTIAHTVGAAGVGAQAQMVFNNVPISVISGILTLLILLLSEIVPKTLGAVHWRKLAVPSAYSIHILTLILWPLIAVCQFFSRLFTPEGKSATISRDEIRAMADLGHEEGVIDKGDARMIQSLMRFNKVRVHEVFTPRPVVKCFKETDTVKDILELGDELAYSRYPVLADPERISGYVRLSEILMAAARDQFSRSMQDLAHEVLIIPEQMPLKGALRLFLEKHDHLAAVVDEFGSFAGVLTLEDVLETLIGLEIMDEADTVADLRELARQSPPNNMDEDENPAEGDSPSDGLR